MDEDSITLRLWRTFSDDRQRCSRSSGERVTGGHTGLSRLLYKLSPIRTIYAAEIEEQTTIQKLGQQKPVLLLQQDEVQKYIMKETGRERLRDLFHKRDGKLHPDMHQVLVVSQSCGIVTLLATSVFGARIARETFIKKRKHTKFNTKFTAARAYNDVLIIGALKFGGTWGLKVFFFTTMYLTIAQCIATYRNKSSVWEYTLATGMTAALLRSNLGLRGMVAGGVVGSVLGTVAGTAFYLLMNSKGETQDARHYWYIQQRLHTMREDELSENQSRNLSMMNTSPEIS